MPTQETEVFYDMPANEYHLDDGGPRLSQSLATLILHRSPQHAYFACPGLGLDDYVFEPDDGDGSIIHALLLEPNGGTIEEIDAPDFKTKAAREQRDAAKHRGKIPMVSSKLGAFQYKAKALRHRLETHKARPIVLDGRSEVVIYWTEETPSGSVRCRARLDHLKKTNDGERLLAVDVKTCDSAHARDVGRQSWQLGYEIQRAAYVRAVEAAFPAYVGAVDFLFAFCEIDRPYAVNPVELTPKFARLGEVRWERARNKWAECLAADDWPGYPGNQIDPPAWAETEEMGADE